MCSIPMTAIVFVVLIAGALLGALVRNVVHGNQIDQDLGAFRGSEWQLCGNSSRQLQ